MAKARKRVESAKKARTARPKLNKLNKPAAKSKTVSGLPAGSKFFVGIGASAGGLEALRMLVSNLEHLADATLIVVQHLSPQHRSMLVDLISRETKLSVKEAADGESPRVNTIYITPPNSNIFYEQGRLRLRAPVTTIGPKPSVDLFLESLADEVGDQSVGIILSGTGSDGARGIKAIRAAGGITMSQAPASAKYDGMPVAAMETGAVDVVASPEGLAKEINSLAARAQRERAALESKAEDPYRDLIARLKADSGVDFGNYKPNTIRRRLHRRMLTNHVATLEEYLSYLDAHPKEIKQLFQDILISVTCFFRDQSAFDELEKQMVRQMRGSFPERAYRAWVPGCASGEEAYTIAMMLTECLERVKSDLRIQVFATDLSEPALAFARKGLYPESALERVPRRYREKFFTQTNDGFRVRKDIRDKVVFARQDLLKDPPFLKLDLVSCRNVMIYFGSDAQERLFRVFHYALNENGLLFLGKSEAVGRSEAYFKEQSHRARLFARKNVTSMVPNLTKAAMTEAQPVRRTQGRRGVDDSVYRAIAQLAPDSILVDEQFNIKKIYGKMSGLLKIPTGDMSHSVVRYVSPEIRSEMTTLLHRCRKDNTRIVGRPREAMVAGEVRLIQLAAVPLKSEAGTDFLIELLLNQAAPKKQLVSKVRLGSTSDRIRELEQELAATKEHQQTLVEELETSNEELQALNEELQSANEELQSSNEELETANEELHATNEELTTLNEEVSIKSAEATALNDYLEAIQNSIRYPVFVVDKDMRLTRFNTACENVFRASDLAEGKSVRMIPTTVDISSVFDAAEKSLKSEKAITSQLDLGRRVFEYRTQPLLSSKGDLMGVVVILFDVTDLSVALRAVSDKEAMLQSILRNTPAMVSLKDASGRYEFVNDQFLAMHGLKFQDVVGRSDDDLFPTVISQAIRERDFEVLTRRRAVMYDEEIESDGAKKVFFSAKVPLLDSKQHPRSICTISLDVTEQKHQEEIIRAQQEQLIRVGKLSALGEMAAGIAHELNTPLNAIVGHIDVLELLAQSEEMKAEDVLKAGHDITKLVDGISNIITSLRNIARMENSGFVRKDLRALVRETAQICQLHLKNHGVELRLRLPNDPVEAECQPIQLTQVLINLINNAVDAIGHKEDKWICIELEKKLNDVELRVIDCGDGIDEDIADKIMTPFFTTKAPGMGTGMGLSLSQSIIDIHHGKLFLDRGHENTCFKVILPTNQVSTNDSSEGPRA